MAQKALWKNWKVLLWGLFIIGSFFLIATNGLKLGTEFSGGTLFQLQLAEPASAQQLQDIRLIVEKRLNPTGIRDVTVSSTGQSIILAQVAETDPEAVEQLQGLLLRQGRFESFLNGEKIFDGSQIVQVIENPAQGYGAQPTGVGNNYQWTLPFLLNEQAAKDFTRAAFHQCTATGFVNNQKQYQCAYTYFFIDRPSNAFIVYPQSVRNADEEKLFTSTNVQIPSEVDLDEILENAQLQLIEVDANGFTEAQLAMINAPAGEIKNIIYPKSLDESLKAQLAASPLNKVEVNEDIRNPWIVSISGLRDVIGLTPSVVHLEPYVENVEDAAPQQFLVIQGTAPDAATAKLRLDDLKILLKSGALPIPIVSINKQTISAELGSSFLSNVWLMGLLALLVVAIIVFIRYRALNLVAPVLFVGLSEVIMILGFAALVKWNLDLASMAGILAAVGTGVDSEVIMTDELMRGEEEQEEKGWINRAKRAFFIVMASAATNIVSVLPLLFFGSGLGKLSGFALTTIAGVLLGILISRPAFQEIIKTILIRKTEHKHAHGDGHHATPAQ